MTDEKKKPFTYFVNGEEQETQDNKQTLEEILAHAQLAPASDYELEDDANHKIYTDPGAEISLHKGQRFTATYKGTTPTS